MSFNIGDRVTNWGMCAGTIIGFDYRDRYLVAWDDPNYVSEDHGFYDDELQEEK